MRPSPSRKKTLSGSRPGKIEQLRTLLQERVCLAGKVPQYLAACFPRLSTFTVELDIAQTKPGILRPPSRSDEQEI